MGRGGLRGRARRGQADAARHRRRVVPLVPRDGRRVVRGSGRRRDLEPPVRVREGGSRRAPRRGRPLSARRSGTYRARRLAAHCVPDSRGRGVLRGHVFPARGQPLRPARLRLGAAAGRGRLPRRSRQGRKERRGDPPARGRVARRGARGRGGAAPGRAGRRPNGAPLRYPLRGVRHGPQVPAPGGLRVPAGALVGHPPRLAARGGREDARRDGARRGPRPRGRRLPPLRGGRALDRAALREDVVRQLGAAPRLPVRLPGAGERSPS